MNTKDIAEICYAVDKAYTDSIGGPKKPEWDGLLEWQRICSVDGVSAQLSRLALTAEQVHKEWRQKMLALGWSYGLIEDHEAKESPYLIAYKYLPKGYLTRLAVCRAIIKNCANKEEKT